MEGDRIVGVGSGLDGDEVIDVSGSCICPGFIDCHVHFMADGNLDPMYAVRTPFSLNFYLAAERMARTLAAAVTSLVPTLIAPMGVLEAADRGVAVPEYAIDKTKLVMDTHRDSIRRAIAAGVTG